MRYVVLQLNRSGTWGAVSIKSTREEAEREREYFAVTAHYGCYHAVFAESIAFSVIPINCRFRFPLDDEWRIKTGDRSYTDGFNTFPVNDDPDVLLW